MFVFHEDYFYLCVHELFGNRLWVMRTRTLGRLSIIEFTFRYVERRYGVATYKNVPCVPNGSPIAMKP